MANLSKLPTLDQLRLMDTSGYPTAGKITVCLLCAKPFLMRIYSGYPDQVCPDCYETYKDCASVLCNQCKVTVAKVRPSILPSGFYVRPRSVMHIPFCAICRPPPGDTKVGELACVSYVIEVQQYENRFGRSRKIVVPMRGTRMEDIK